MEDHRVNSVLDGLTSVAENLAGGHPSRCRGRMAAFFGHGVSLLTGTHDPTVIGPERKHAIPREGRDIVVGEGAWIASNATVLGPCRIGAHAVVAAGSLVKDDVPEYTVVAGVPARPIRVLDKL